MNVIVSDENFDTKELVQSAKLIIQEPDTFEATIEDDTSMVIKEPARQTVQYDEDSWLLFNASLKALTNATLEQLLSQKLSDLNTGIYEYINQVSTAKEQAVTEARALVANLQNDVSNSVSTLLQYNNVRATETASNASTITALNSDLQNTKTNVSLHASAIQTLNTEVGDESSGIIKSLNDAHITIDTLRSQVDSVITYYFTDTEFVLDSDGNPTDVSLAPDKNSDTAEDAPWDTSIKKQKHNEDIWYIRNTKKAQRYSYALDKWYEDEALTNLHLDVLAAQNTADNKANVWYGDVDPSSNWTDDEKTKAIGDLWVQETTIDDKPFIRTYRWNGTQWVDISDTQIHANAQAITDLNTRLDDPDNGLGAQATAIQTLNTEVGIKSGGLKQAVADLQSQVDGVVETWLDTHEVLDSDNKIDATQEPYKTWYDTDTDNGDTNERSKHTGDTYIKYSTDDNGVKHYIQSYRFYKGNIADETDDDGFGWFVIVDQTAIDAQTAALAAQDTADGKRRVFVDTPKPPYDIGDLWTDGSHIYKCVTAKVSGDYSEDDFDMATDYTNDDTVNTFIATTFTDYKATIKAQLDHKREFFFTEGLVDDDNNSLAPSVTNNWTEEEQKLHNKDVWYVTGIRKAYLYDYVADSWYEDPLTVSLASSIWEAQQTGDAKANIWYDSSDPAASWTDTEKEINVNDLWVKETFKDDGSLDTRTTYRYDKTVDGDTTTYSWKDISDTRISALEEDVSAFKAQADHAREIWVQTSDPAENWTDQDTMNAHHGDVWDNEGTIQFYSAITGAWFTDSILAKQMEDIIAAQNTADGKGHIYYMSLEDANSMKDGWADTEKTNNIGDLLITSDNHNQSLRWNGTSWEDVSDTRIDANSSAITNLETVLTTPGATYNGKTTVLNDLTSSYDSAAADLVTLNSKYTVTTELGTDGNKYITGFGLNSEVTVADDGSTNEVSDFIIKADKFKLIDPTSANSVLMDEDGLYFKKADGTTAKYLQFMHTYNNHPNSQVITLNNLTRVPQVLMGLHTMPTYSSAHKDQDQSFTFSVEDVVDTISTNGTYSFKPVAHLHLTANTFSEVLTGTFTDSSSDVKYSDSYHVETALNPTTISYNVNSVKGTGTANEYHYRQCSIQMQKSTNNTTWTNIGDAVTATMGKSVTGQAGSITYTGDIGAGNYIRLKFTFSNASGTFTLGDTGYWDYQTAEAGNTSQFTRGSYLPSGFNCCGSSFDCNHSGSETEGACSNDWGSDKPTSGCFYATATCNSKWTGSGGTIYWMDVKQKYAGTECYSPNAVRDSLLPGYTVTSYTFSISDKTNAGIKVINNFGWDGSGSMYSANSKPGEAPRAYYEWDHTLDSYLNSLSAYITTTITAKKWITQSGSTTTKNTVTDLALQATAKSGIELATGTMNILVVE